LSRTFLQGDYLTCASYPVAPNVRDQRRRAVGAPLAKVALKTRRALVASGVTTRDDRCIA
jgi:hypothetical protein